MIHLSVFRSEVRALLMVATGVLLVLVALDVLWVHGVEIGDCSSESEALCLRDLAGPPETDADTGLLTSRGRSQQRTDYLWGSVLLVAGFGLAGLGTMSLLRRAPVVEVRDDGLRLRIAGPGSMVQIPWDEITWLHSGSDGDDEVVPPRIFLVHVVDPSSYPSAPWGATWDGSTLMVDADSWNVEPEEVVAHARMALDRWRRMERGGGAAPAEEEVS